MNYTIDFDALSRDLHESFSEDVAQATLLRMLSMKLDRVANVGGFARRVAMNVKVDDMRAQAMRTYYASNVTFFDGFEHEPQLDLTDEVDAALALTAPETVSYLKSYFGVGGKRLPRARDKAQAARRREITFHALERIRHRLGVTR